MRHGLVSKRLDYKTGKLLSALIPVVVQENRPVTQSWSHTARQVQRTEGFPKDPLGRVHFLPNVIWETEDHS